MISASIPDNEEARLRELYEYKILDSDPEEDFDEIVKMASGICNAPISLVTLVDANRQWFKAKYGLEANETDRKSSFCAHAMQNSDLFIIPDASCDNRFYDNPLVTGSPDIRFYVGVPLVSAIGGRMGALCVIDTVPRELTEQQQEVLRILGKQVVKLMDIRRKNIELQHITALERAHSMELERISAIQTRIMSILAHDMRGPLGALRGLLDLDIPPETFKGMALNQVNITLDLLDNIVEWGAVERAGKREDFTPFSVRELVQEILHSFSVAASIKGIRMHQHINPDLKLNADHHALRFLLRNLLTNAIKFTTEGDIFITAEIEEEHIKIKVKDTGIGMEPAMVEKLFQGNRNASRKGTHDEKGSGLGLSLIKDFIDKNKGSIYAESAPGSGTTIIFTLPLQNTFSNT